MPVFMVGRSRVGGVELEGIVRHPPGLGKREQSLSFPGSAWEREAANLSRSQAPPGNAPTARLRLANFKERGGASHLARSKAEPGNEKQPGGAWERGIVD